MGQVGNIAFAKTFKHVSHSQRDLLDFNLVIASPEIPSFKQTACPFLCCLPVSVCLFVISF